MIKKTAAHILVIFGASGDLTARKLVPALFNLFCRGFLPDCFAILGSGRSPYSDGSFREKVVFQNKHLRNNKHASEDSMRRFAEKLYYQTADTSREEDFRSLRMRLNEVDKVCKTDGNCIFYLSTPPFLYEIIPASLAKQGLNDETNGWKRLIIEKPFGYDLPSARVLNKKVLTYFSESQVYRIDHYLGKETVQNILVTRFANSIYEPLWNRNYIHHVEISAAESVGVEKRGGYYDDAGALRDMVQNHLLQLLALIAMEPPTQASSEAIRNEKLKVFQSMRPLSEEDIANNVIRGQYINSTIKGEEVPGYREEKGVPLNSRTETYAALKFYIDNWRWAGVPFYIRTGKRLPTRVTEVVIHFKSTPHHLFVNESSVVNSNNILVIRIQPNEGILLKFGMKIPGEGFKVRDVNMDFHYDELANTYVPEAYERLLLDCMQGDATLYSRGDSVEAAWEFIDPILTAWKENPNLKIFGYPAGTWGPENADELIEGDKITWRYPCKNLADDGIYCEL